jgi:hypothetical protein
MAYRERNVEDDVTRLEDRVSKLERRDKEPHPFWEWASKSEVFAIALGLVMFVGIAVSTVVFANYLSTFPERDTCHAIRAQYVAEQDRGALCSRRGKLVSVVVDKKGKLVVTESP